MARLSDLDPAALDAVLKTMKQLAPQPQPPTPESQLTEKGRQDYAVAVAEYRIVERLVAAVKSAKEKK